MPIIKSKYSPLFALRNGHIQTCLPVLFRAAAKVPYTRERLELSDGDFIDLDWSFADNASTHMASKAALVIHGLEGHAHRKYVLGMTHALNQAGWDVCAMNHRSCSGVANRLARSYHSGETNDVMHALQRMLSAGKYPSAAIVGFSMGGNQTLKLLGEAPPAVPEQVKAAVAISAPCDLAACADKMDHGLTRLYQAYLMHSLKRKIRAKHPDFPDQLPLAPLDGMTAFREFDNTYTAPLSGFRNAEDYYAKCSSKQFLHAIRVPTLIMSAEDDPFLPDACYPIAEAQSNPVLHLEMPKTGGHVGFAINEANGDYWTEVRSVEFLAKHMP